MDSKTVKFSEDGESTRLAALFGHHSVLTRRQTGIFSFSTLQKESPKTPFPPSQVGNQTPLKPKSKWARIRAAIIQESKSIREEDAALAAAAATASKESGGYTHSNPMTAGKRSPRSSGPRFLNSELLEQSESFKAKDVLLANALRLPNPLLNPALEQLKPDDCAAQQIKSRVFMRSELDSLIVELKNKEYELNTCRELESFLKQTLIWHDEDLEELQRVVNSLSSSFDESELLKHKISTGSINNFEQESLIFLANGAIEIDSKLIELERLKGEQSQVEAVAKSSEREQRNLRRAFGKFEREVFNINSISISSKPPPELYCGLAAPFPVE